MFTDLKLALDFPIARLIVQRPESRNAIRSHTMHELAQAITLLEQSGDLRCVILTGAGDEAFVAGGDLKELKSCRSQEEALALSRSMGLVLRRLELLDCPVIIAINGVAIGGGCEMTLAGDRRLIADDATLSFRQATLGLTCGWGGLTRLERLVGRSKAFQLLLIEETVSASRALELGLVDEVVPKSLLMDRADALARQLSALPPLAVRAIKRGLVRSGDMAFDRALDYESELFARTWASEDHWEAVEAFFGHRSPKLAGR